MRRVRTECIRVATFPFRKRKEKTQWIASTVRSSTLFANAKHLDIGGSDGCWLDALVECHGSKLDVSFSNRTRHISIASAPRLMRPIGERYHRGNDEVNNDIAMDVFTTVWRVGWLQRKHSDFQIPRTPCECVCRIVYALGNRGGPVAFIMEHTHTHTRARRRFLIHFLSIQRKNINEA